MPELRAYGAVEAHVKGASFASFRSKIRIGVTDGLFETSAEKEHAKTIVEYLCRSHIELLHVMTKAWSWHARRWPFTAATSSSLRFADCGRFDSAYHFSRALPCRALGGVPHPLRGTRAQSDTARAPESVPGWCCLSGADVGPDPVIQRLAGIEGIDHELPYDGGVPQ